MIPLKLTLHNFMSYQGAVLDFSVFDFAVLTGTNGAGKSTILEAITWALWGKTRGGGDDGLVRQNANEMWVEIIFQADKNKYRVLRRRDKKGRGQSILEFQVENRGLYQTLTEPTIRQTQEKISKTIHLPYEIFTNSSYLRQGHADEFTIKSPIERKEILAEILNLEIYDKLAEKAKEKLREHQNEEQSLIFDLERIEETLSREEEIEKKYQNTSAGLDKLNKELKKEQIKFQTLETKKEQIDLLKNKVEQSREEYRRTQNLINNNQKKINELQEEIIQQKMILGNKTGILRNYEDLKKYQKENTKLTNKLLAMGEWEQRKKILEHEKEKLEETIGRLTHIKKCPTCLRILSVQEAEKIIRGLKKEFEEKIAPQIKKAEKELNKIGYDKNAHRVAREKIELLENAEAEKQKLDLSEQKIESNQKEIDNLEKQKIGFWQTKDGIEKEGKKLSAEIRKLNPGETEKQWRTQKEKIDKSQIELNELNRELGGLIGEKKLISENKTLFKNQKKKLQIITVEKGIYNDLTNVYSKKGVQAMIIEEVIPAIENECNLLLSKITGNRLRLELKTQRTKKHSEEVMETLDILISDELGTRPYELYSGGEAFRINFALRLAISKLLAFHSGANLKFLVIDEGFGALDAAGREDIVSAINAIKNDFEKILIVTHLEELKDVFATKIEVTKTEKGSELKIIA